MSHNAKFFSLWSDEDLERAVKNAARHAPNIVAMAKDEIERRRREKRRAVKFVRMVQVDPARIGRTA